MTIYQAESTDPAFKTFRSLSEHKTREHLAEYLDVILGEREYWDDYELSFRSERLRENIKRISVGPCDTITALGHTYQILSPMDPESPDELKRLTLAEYLGYPVEDIMCFDAFRFEYSCDGEIWCVLETESLSAEIVLCLDDNKEQWTHFRDHILYKIP